MLCSRISTLYIKSFQEGMIVILSAMIHFLMALFESSTLLHLPLREDMKVSEAINLSWRMRTSFIKSSNISARNPLSPLSNSKHCEALHKTAFSCHPVTWFSVTQWWEHDLIPDLQFSSNSIKALHPQTGQVFRFYSYREAAGFENIANKHSPSKWLIINYHYYIVEVCTLCRTYCAILQLVVLTNRPV